MDNKTASPLRSIDLTQEQCRMLLDLVLCAGWQKVSVETFPDFRKTVDDLVNKLLG